MHEYTCNLSDTDIAIKSEPNVKEVYKWYRRILIFFFGFLFGVRKYFGFQMGSFGCEGIGTMLFAHIEYNIYLGGGLHYTAIDLGVCLCEKFVLLPPPLILTVCYIHLIVWILQK